LIVLSGILNLINALNEELHYDTPQQMINYIYQISSQRDAEVFLGRNRHKKTLEEIAGEMSVTRERVRQIEIKITEKIQKSILRKGAAAYIAKWVEYLSTSGGVMSFDQACEELHENIDFDDFEVLCVCAGEGMGPIYLFELDGGSVISKYKKDVLETAYKTLISDVINFVGQTKDELRESLKLDMEYDQMVEDFCLHKLFRTDAHVRDDRLIGIKGKNVLNVESVFMIAGKALHFDEAEKMFYELFGRNVNFRGMFGRGENIILWGRGTYIHKDLIDVNLEPIEKVYRLIQDALQNLEKKTTATSLFDKNQALMSFMRIPAPQALYSILRMNDDDRYLYRKYPDIEHSENVDCARKERDDELNEYFLEMNKPLYKDDLVDYFVKKRGMRDYQIFFAMDRCPDIYKMGGGRYAHAETVGVTKKMIHSLINQVESALAKHNPIILGEIMDELNLPDISPYQWGRQLVASIVKKNSDYKVIYHAAITTKNNETINTIEDLILYIVKTSARKFTKASLTVELRLKKITTNLMTIEKFINKYGFLLVK
jgi:transcriptional regulator with XRE-family HTH domain